MEGGAESPPLDLARGGELVEPQSRKVVFLAHDRMFLERLFAALGRGFRCAQVGSPYEAAGELLAEPAACLVVDLRLLNSSHKGLLEIAQQARAEVLGFGRLPSGMTSEELWGLRLVPAGKLAQTIAAMGTEPRTVATTEAAVDPWQSRGAGQVATSAKTPPEAQHIEKTDDMAASKPAEAKGEDAGGKAGQSSSPAQTYISEDSAAKMDSKIIAENLLTPEELSALLGGGEK